LSDADFIPLYHAFLKAFSDYAVNMNVSEQRFRDRLVRDGVKLYRFRGCVYREGNGRILPQRLRSLARAADRLRCGHWNVANLPRVGLGRDLFGYIDAGIKEGGVEQCLLEVLSNNLPALKLYRKLGFSETRTFAVCQQTNIVERPVLVQIELHDVDVPAWRLYQTFWMASRHGRIRSTRLNE